MSNPKPEMLIKALDIHDAAAITPVYGGAASQVWRVETARGPFALRLCPPWSPIDDELRAQRAAGAAGLPVPEVQRTAMLADRWVMWMTWLPGEPLTQILLRDPARIDSLGEAFGRLQAALHAVAPPPGFDPRAWISAIGSEEAALMDRLRALPPHGPALLHLDFHPNNVLCDGERITGLLDWANARAGDPRADFARTFSILRVEPWRLDGDPAQMDALRERAVAAWRRGYGGEPPAMSAFYAWAGAFMLRDLGERLTPDGRQHVTRWTTAMKRAAGVEP